MLESMAMSKARSWYPFLLIAGAAVLAAAFLLAFRGTEKPVSSFRECEERGYPVMESYPRQCRGPEGRVFTEDVEGTGPHPSIHADVPQPGQEAASPFIVRGEAKGSWFFEGDFPVRLLDGDGKEIASAPAKAIGEWMTDSFVPFEAVLTFPPSASGAGTLILEKANPSGLAEHADSVRIPLKLADEGDAFMLVRAHMTAPNSGEIDCTITWGAPRVIPRTQAPARAALEQLFLGPSGWELEHGLGTAINPGVEIQSLLVENGTAFLDLSSAVEEQTGGSCRVAAIFAQIRNTLLEFPSVSRVVLSVDGRTDDILQP